MSWGNPVAWYWPIPQGFEVLEVMRRNPEVEVVTVPYAVVVGVYVLAWAGLLVWRARKYRQVPVAEGEA